MRAALLLLLLQASSAVSPASLSGLVTEARAPYIHPLFNARVELVGESEPNPVVRTGADGRFLFSNLRGGRYRLLVTQNGYIRKVLNVVVPQGQNSDARIEMDLAPTVFGHIRDRYNVPMSNILVEALKVGYGPRGDRTITALESALTDDRGEYHLYWLDNGEYYIRASPLSRTLPVQDAVLLNYVPAGSQLGPTYNPGTRNLKEAATIRLRAGSTYGPMDFQMQINATAGITGFISTAGGSGYAGLCHADVFVTPAGASASMQQYQGRSACANPPGLGFYSVGGFWPGVYIVSSEFTVDGVVWMLHRKIEVKAVDRGISLTLVAGTQVHGQIVAEPEGAINLRLLRFTLESSDPELPSPRVVQVDATGEFLASAEPGDYSPRVLNLPGDAYVKFAISSGGDERPVHVESKPLELGQITLATDGGHMDGLVVDDSGHPISNAIVVLVPDAGRRSSPQQYRTADSDADGRFTIRGIPPGDYKAFAWESAEENAYLNADYLRNYEGVGAPMNVPPSSALTETLRVIVQN